MDGLLPGQHNTIIHTVVPNFAKVLSISLYANNELSSAAVADSAANWLTVDPILTLNVVAPVEAYTAALHNDGK